MDKNPYAPSSLESIKQQSQAEGKLTLVSMADRVGVHRFLVSLEHTLFSPKIKPSDDFELYMVHWEELVWIVVVIPIKFMMNVELIATNTGMRIADGIPHLISSKGIVKFPLEHNRVYTIENTKDSMVYLPGGEERLRNEEKEWIDNFFKNIEEA
jgi:hypothetical protein